MEQTGIQLRGRELAWCVGLWAPPPTIPSHEKERDRLEERTPKQQGVTVAHLQCTHSGSRSRRSTLAATS